MVLSVWEVFQMNESDESGAALLFSAILIRPNERSWVTIQSVLPQDSNFYISGDFFSLSSCHYKLVVNILHIFAGFRFDNRSWIL